MCLFLQEALLDYKGSSIGLMGTLILLDCHNGPKLEFLQLGTLSRGKTATGSGPTGAARENSCGGVFFPVLTRLQYSCSQEDCSPMGLSS